MPKFNVRVRWATTMTVEVEANNSEEAVDAALEKSTEDDTRGWLEAHAESVEEI